MNRKFLRILPSILVLLFVWLPAGVRPACAGLLITEFMAANDTGETDEDGDCSDWIGLYNAGTSPVDLDSWKLKASGNTWTFPATNVSAGEYLVVFASGKDRAAAGSELHTDFQLAIDGEYLALLEPDDTPVSEFNPYPRQIPDVSYGVGAQTESTNLIPTGAACRWHVPTSDVLGSTWQACDGFDDSGWGSGPTGVGYETGSGYESLIGVDVQSQMLNTIGTVYIRIPFVVDDPLAYNALLLKMKYDDGFVAYVNGTEVMRKNAAGEPPAWNADATAAHDDAAAVVFEVYDISEDAEYLAAGTNVLAIHGLNDGVGSSDLLLLPELVAGLGTTTTESLRYFSIPTPGGVNGVGTADLGPVIRAVSHAPHEPVDTDDVVVTATVTDTIDGVASVTLYYRVMWNSEASLGMYDDGAHGDGAASDGVYGATIPASVSSTGQMVRYYIVATDGAAHQTRHPLTDDTVNYLGWVVQDPSIATEQPVYHLFFQNPNWYHDGYWVGNRTWQDGCLYANGEFHDNIRSRGRGGVSLSSSYNKRKKIKIEFKKGHYFQFSPEYPRVDEFNVGRAYIAEPVGYEIMGKNGPTCVSFPVHYRMNGAFWDLGVFLEQVDWRCLERNGIDPNGALYKAKNSPSACLVSTGGFQIKSREEKLTADWSHLQTLVNGIKLTDLTARRNFLFDTVNVPEVVNWIAMASVIGYTDRTYKNYYIYRDKYGNGEFWILPWDLDDALSNNSGQADDDGTGAHPFYGDYWHPQGATMSDYYNRLYSAIFHTPETSEMYLRRLRSVRDEFLPPSTVIRDPVDYWTAALSAEGQQSTAIWAGWGWTYFTNQPVQYTTLRAEHLDNHELVPASQPAEPDIEIGTIEWGPASGNQDEEYIELINPNAMAIDITGWTLANAVEFTFRPGTVIRAGASMYVSPDVVAFRARATSPTGGEGRFVQGRYRGHLSSWGETVELYDKGGRLVAAKSYEGAPSDPQRYLRITELMYNPLDPVDDDGWDGEEYEFIEIQNTGTNSLDISGAYFTSGVQFTFPASTTLEAGACIVVVANQAAFTSMYENAVAIAGEYTGRLDNGGEDIKLEDALSQTIVEFDWKDGWQPDTDGKGYSLTILDASAEPGAKTNWRTSYSFGGSPGWSDAPSVVINEVLAHTDPPLEDCVEIFNPTGGGIDIGGWYLSDDLGELKKYQIPGGTVVPAGGYHMIYESAFNADTNDPNCFAFGEHGESVFLAAAGGGVLTGYRAGQPFGASEHGRAMGRYQTSVGVDFPRLSTRTTNAPNSYPQVGPVVISEIMYNPEEGGDEFIELYNLSGTATTLYDPLYPSNTWRLSSAVDYVFPQGVEMAANSYLLVVPTSPAAFRAKYGLSPSMPIYGPYTGSLDNRGESLKLFMPDTPDPDGYVAYIRIDRVQYDDGDPWPQEADGEGPSLERVVLSEYGNDPVNWRTIACGGTPGAEADTTGGLLIATNSQWNYHAEGVDLGTVWRAAEYSHGDWADDQAPLGYGASNCVVTLIPYGPDPDNKYRTTYFRKRFVLVDDPMAVVTLTLNANYDDGFVAYLNGQEVARQSMPGGTITYDIFADSHGWGSYEPIDITAGIDHLVRGENTLAVELHQTGAGSSDLVWDGELRYGVSTVPRVQTPVLAPAGRQFADPLPVTISCGTPGATIRYTIDGGTPTESSALYAGAFALSNACTVKAKAWKAGYNASLTAAEDYTKVARTVAFAAPSSSGSEADATAALAVTLNVPAESVAVTVGYTVNEGAGTATRGADFTLADGTLTFAPGQMTRTIDVSVTDDLVDEDEETVVVGLSGPVNAVLGGTQTHTYTIVDNERWMADYLYRRKLTVDHTLVSGSGELADFPILVRVTDDTLRTTGNGGHVCSAAGYDILFAGAAETNVLKHEIEKYGAGTGELIAWVRVPALAGAQDTVLYLYYGNESVASPQQDPAAVWDSGFVMVNHLAQAPTGTVCDSTANANHATPHNMTGEDLTAAVIGDGLDFDGTDDYLSVASASSLNLHGDSFTEELWLVMPGTAKDQYWVAFLGYDPPGGTLGTADRYPGFWTEATNKLHAGFGDGTAWRSVITDNAVLTLGQPNLVAATFNGTYYRIYVNGTEVYSTNAHSGRTPYGTQELRIGSTSDGGDWLGRLDEVRISQVARSADWLATCHANQSAPGSFLSLGAEEDGGGLVPRVAFAAANSARPEADTTVAVELVLSCAADSAVTVGYSVADGQSTASAGADFTLAAGAVTFTPGQTSRTFDVALHDDAETEGDETVVIMLSGPVGAELGSTTAHTLTILDNEAWLSGYRCRRRLTIDHTQVGGADDLTNFPVLISLTDESLRTTNCGGHVCHAEAYDLVFADATLTNRLAHEIERYAAASGTLVAWVTVPVLHAEQDTALCLYYGNESVDTPQQDPTNVWEAGFVMVNHMAQAPTGTVRDSTLYANHATPHGMDAGDLVPGVAGHGLEFDGSAAWLGIAEDGSLNLHNDPFTEEFWVALPNPPKDAYFVALLGYDPPGGDPSTADRYPGLWIEGTNRIHAGFGDGAGWRSFVNDSDVLTPGQTQLLAVTFDGTTYRLYVDGAPAYATTAHAGRTPYGTEQLRIGSVTDTGGFIGTMDEVRISQVARSAGWLATCHANQCDPAAFVRVAPQETAGGAMLAAKIAKGALWRYRKGTAEPSSPATAWREPAFDDGPWAMGSAPLGYGPLAYGTTLADMQGSYCSVALRREFALADPLLVSELMLEVDFDDGFIAWINGTEVARVNVAGARGSFVAHDAPCSGYVADSRSSWAACLSGADLPALQATNVLAVQVFNSGLGSSDLIVDAALSVLEGSAAPNDADRDGMSDDWESANLAGGDGDSHADPDGDGLSNIEEYIAGTDPETGTNSFEVSLTADGPDIVVSFPTVEATGPGYAGLARYYALETRTGLAAADLWLPVAGYTNILGLGQTVTHTNACVESSCYYRGRVWLR
ncbi:MAG: DUF2341 domain-containing protein [Kiritimatiellae bacterium]|nr:DUF2341 domain-containing protein [Kiritimatiellia bacterium]